MPANSYPLFINHDLNKPQVWLLNDYDDEDGGYIHLMAFRQTLRFMVHRIVSVEYEPPC